MCILIGMDVHTNIPLKNYLTMRLGGPARFMTDAVTKEEIRGLYKNAMAQNLEVYVLGGGSNTLAKDEGFSGLVLRNRIMGVEEIAQDESSVTFRFGAGETWDDCVKMSVGQWLTGIEALSAIPGTIGAAPVQNIGAYGQELSDVFVELTAYDTTIDAFVTLDAEACEFSYRHSIFRGHAAGRYIVTDVTLRLYRSAPTPPFYKAIEQYFEENKISLYTPKVIRDAVTHIRADKLPDPAERPNTGSFFKNAIVEKWLVDDLLKQYPDMPHYDFGNGTFKVPTGWLIEQCGFKGELLHGMRVNEKNALVLINESATSYNDLAAARDEIAGKVRDTFRILIEQEPLEIPSA